MNIQKTPAGTFIIGPSTPAKTGPNPSWLPWWGNVLFALALAASAWLFKNPVDEMRVLAGKCVAAAVIAEWGVFTVAWRTKTYQVSYEDAKDALDHMKDWAKWLATINTGAIGALGFVFTAADKEAKPFALAAIAVLGSSLFCVGWLLGALPSIRQRLTKHPDPNYENDIYAGKMFGNCSLKLQACAGSASFLGIIGLVLFALAFIARLKVDGQRKIEPSSFNIQGLDKPLELRLIPMEKSVASPVHASPPVSGTPIPEPNPEAKDTLATPKPAVADKP